MSGVFHEKGAKVPRQVGMSRPDSRGPLVEALRQQLGKLGAAATEEAPAFSCGAGAVDRLLPGGGLRHGMLVEWMGVESRRAGEQESRRAGEGKRSGKSGCSSAVTLALLAAREACREGGVLVVIDRARTFYPPAAAAWDVDLGRLIVVWPQNTRDELWAAVQALRSPVVAAVWASIDRLDSCAFRRLQLAAEEGCTLGALVRPASARGQPTWADVRLEVENFGLRISDCGLIQPIRNPKSEIRNRPIRRTFVHLVHCHSGRVGGAAMLEIDDVARTVQQVSSTDVPVPLSVVTQLADSAGRSLPARA